MLNSLELEEREISSVELGKEGNKKKGKSVSLISFTPQRTTESMPSEEGILGGFVEDQGLEHLSLIFSWFTFLFLPVPRIPEVNWNQKISESYFWTQSWLSHILPYLALHKRPRENGMMWLLCSDLNEKDGSRHAFLNMWYTKILFCRTVSKGRCRTKEVQALIWDNDGQEVAGESEKMWVS